MRNLLTSALILTLACASASKRPATIAEPEISVRQAGPTFFGTSAATTLSFNVLVTNHANVPLHLREIELSSPGMTHYAIQRTIKRLDEVIPPGATRQVGMEANAYAEAPRAERFEPLNIRAVLRFEAAGKSWREVVLDQSVGS